MKLFQWTLFIDMLGYNELDQSVRHVLHSE
jgi:hypothetical protein